MTKEEQIMTLLHMRMAEVACSTMRYNRDSKRYRVKRSFVEISQEDAKARKQAAINMMAEKPNKAAHGGTAE